MIRWEESCYVFEDIVDLPLLFIFGREVFAKFAFVTPESFEWEKHRRRVIEIFASKSNSSSFQILFFVLQAKTSQNLKRERSDWTNESL